ncbi:Endo-1,4-beta-xylanase A precursor [compost metagenome]
MTNLELQDQYWDTSSSALFGPIQYSYYFNLKRNGIPSVDSVSITVDSNGNVTQYSVAIEDMNYPSATPVISQAAAEKKLQNDFDAELYYIPITRKGALQEWILGWRPTDESIYSIDAKTGQRINYSGEQISPVSRVVAAVPKAKTVFQARTEGTEMTSKAAVQIIEKAAVIPPKRSLASQTLEKDYIDPQRKVWRLMWQDKSENVQDNYYPTQTEATVDAVSGQILEYRIDGYGLTSSQSLLPAPSKGTKLTKTSARQKAYELINALYPDASSKLKLVEYAGDDHYDKENGLYSFEFGLYVNDIPVFSGQSTISFDQYGRLMYYNADRVTDLDKITASPTPEVTKKAAIQDYLSHYKLNLKYSRSGGYYTNNNAYIEPRISLVYETEINDESGYYKALDAHSGKWVLLNDYPIYGSYTAAAEAVDIKGHWAEKELTTLLEHKIIVLDDEYRVKPEEQITTGEWLSMMVKAITPYYSGYNEYVYYGDGVEKLSIAGVKVDSIYYDVVSYAAERQWFDQNKTLQVDEKLTREQLAVLLTSIVRYDKLAAFLKQDSSLNQFSDAASIQNPGAVALCVKLGLLQGQNGQFNPNGKVTRAEAAAIMMNLVKLQGKTDQAINQ